MWLDAFAAQLRAGLDAVRHDLDASELDAARRAYPALDTFDLSSLIAFGRLTGRGRTEQDAVWLAVVRCYRHRSPHLWTPVLLHMLAPGLIGRAHRLALDSPQVDPAEIQQQLVAEVLLAADSQDLHDGSRRVQQRLLARAGHRVEAWIGAEAGDRPLSLNAISERRRLAWRMDAEEARWLLSELRLSMTIRADLELVVRVLVLRESADEIAKTMGVPSRDVTAHFRSARRRIRRELG